MNKDTGDEKQVSKAKSQVKFDRETQLNAMRLFLSTHDGRAYLWELIGKCSVFGAVKAFHDNDTNFNLGKREMGLLIIAEINEADPEAFGLMQTEAMARGKENGS